MSFLLFHSYNYVNCKYNINNCNFYDKNKNLLFSLLNFPNPDCNNLYKIQIKNILQKKKFSYKNLLKKNQYYTKHNIKIYLEINYDYLYYLVLNRLDIPDKTILFKLFNQNQSKINYESNLVYNICINKNYLKEIITMEIPYNINIIKNSYIKNILIDQNNKQLYINKTNTELKYNKGGLLLCDIKFMIINEINDYVDSLTLVITDISQLNLWKKVNIKNNNLIYFTIDDLNNKNLKYQDFKRIIIDLVDINTIKKIKKKFKKSIIWVVNDNLNTIKINQFIVLFNCIYDFDINMDELNTDILINILKYVCYRNYIYKLKKQKLLNTCKNTLSELKCNYNYNYIWYFKLLSIKEKNILKNTCCICLQTFNKNSLCKFQCNHYFCISCTKKLIDINPILNCPMCKQKVLSIVKYEENKKNLIKNNYRYSVDNFIVLLVLSYIKLNCKNNVAIIICPKHYYNFLVNIFKFLDINSENIFHSLHNLEKIVINNTKIYNIYIIEKNIIIETFYKFFPSLQNSKVNIRYFNLF
jgi:hypothetical protein